MEDTSFVRGFESRDDLEHRINRLDRRERPLFLNPLLQCPTRQQLHRDCRHALDVLAAVDVDDVRVVHGGGELAFPQKSRAIDGIAQPRTQHLQGDAAPVLEVLGLIHFTHAATPEQTFDPVQSDPLTGREARRAGGAPVKPFGRRQHRELPLGPHRPRHRQSRRAQKVRIP